MSYDEGLAQRIREQLDDELTEKKMFGGLAFLLGGHMAVGVMGDELMVRVEPDSFDALLGQPGARVFDMGGRTMKGWLVLGGPAIAEDADLARWVERGIAYASALPPK